MPALALTTCGQKRDEHSINVVTLKGIIRFAYPPCFFLGRGKKHTALEAAFTWY